MRVFAKIFLLFTIAASLLLIKTWGSPLVIQAETAEERLERLGREIGEYEAELKKLSAQANTLFNQIAQYNAQIALTTLKISSTEEKIILLEGRMEQLAASLHSLTNAFSTRASETYKMARLAQPLILVITAHDLSEAVSRFHYLRRIQEADRDLLIRLQNAQTAYAVEKTSQEELQKTLEEQREVLGAQKTAKANLLVLTRNDEKRYQELLAIARAEFEAIQAIIAGKGEEVEVGGVSEGQTIATVIGGPSCNSSGPHLHFIVSENGSTHNPFNYLNSGIDYENCSGSSCGGSNGDPFNPAGSWIWPINPKVKFSQGYGVTWAVNNTWVGRIYGFHNGIDINSLSSSTVKATKAGTLYRGSYTGYNGCLLRYVRVDHADSNLDTLYLHINY